jgi:hypothetical protein
MPRVLCWCSPHNMYFLNSHFFSSSSSTSHNHFLRLGPGESGGRVLCAGSPSLILFASLLPLDQDCRSFHAVLRTSDKSALPAVSRRTTTSESSILIDRDCMFPTLHSLGRLSVCNLGTISTWAVSGRHFRSSVLFDQNSESLTIVFPRHLSVCRIRTPWIQKLLAIPRYCLELESNDAHISKSRFPAIATHIVVIPSPTALCFSSHPEKRAELPMVLTGLCALWPNSEALSLCQMLIFLPRAQILC